MSSRYAPRFLGLLGVAVALMLPVSAFAELGGDVKSVQRDGVNMKSAVTVRQAQRYTVHELASDSRSSVREFATPEGKIFAVAWHGSFHPDYQQLLGPYFQRMQQATQSAQRLRARRAPVMIETPGFVFQSLGHLRGLAGRAYIPQMLPAGVNVEEIR